MLKSRLSPKWLLVPERRSPGPQGECRPREPVTASAGPGTSARGPPTTDLARWTTLERSIRRVGPSIRGTYESSYLGLVKPLVYTQSLSLYARSLSPGLVNPLVPGVPVVALGGCLFSPKAVAAARS